MFQEEGGGGGVGQLKHSPYEQMVQKSMQFLYLYSFFNLISFPLFTHSHHLSLDLSKPISPIKLYILYFFTSLSSKL